MSIVRNLGEKIMRNVLFALAALALLAGSSPAQQLDTNSLKTFTGLIDDKTRVRGGPPLWTFAKITVVSSTGDKLDCYLMSTTVFTYADGTTHEAEPPITGKHVELKYGVITGGSPPLSGANAAVSLHYLD